MTNACLLLGSNLGNRLLCLSEALLGLENANLTILQISNVYESNPWGFDSHDQFLNVAIIIKTSYSPDDLLLRCLRVESDLGRVRKKNGYSSRTIDIDILLYGELIIDSDTLTVPHPRLPFRRFALLPVVELIADTKHPVMKRTMRQLLDECTDKDDVVFFCSHNDVWAVIINDGA